MDYYDNYDEPPHIHYQTEDPTGGCRGIGAGISGVAVIVILLLAVVFLVFHPGF